MIRPATTRLSVLRANEILSDMTLRLRRGTDWMFFWLLLAQWAFAIVLALVDSPYTYEGNTRSLHPHVKSAVLLGAVINALPMTLIWRYPGWWLTRHVVAASQMLWSSMLIMITGGRLETHFHIFGSLGLVALYRDWKVLPTATGLVVIDHLVRGLLWPDSVYGVSNPEWWIFLEHGGWVIFMNATLMVAIMRSTREMRRAARREARLERTNMNIEAKVAQRTLELQESSERYRALVENTEAVTFEYDMVSARMIYIAPQAARLLDCAPEKLEDQAFLIGSIHPEDREHVWAEFLARAAGNRPWNDPLACRLRLHDDRIVYVRFFLSSVAGTRNVRAIMLDVTRQRQLEAELQNSQKLESVGRLAAGVAHEINTPIQFVGDSVTFMKMSVADLLAVISKQREVVDAVLAAQPNDVRAREASSAATQADLDYILDEVPHAADRALDGVDRVSTIVRSMKVFAHPDGVDKADVDLNAAIMSTLTISRNEYRYVADVKTELADLPPVLCYAGEINQALLNIIVNAAHAIGDIYERTGKRGEIDVATRRVGNNVEITIRDTGGGIPESVRARIFDPFFTTKGVGRGTGQGLSIARAVIVERHGGSLKFETTLGVGTTFRIRLPLQGRVEIDVAA